ncbi:MAG TPA: hypothetical protein VNX65_04535 [Patescibacteria group bacterium]|jgi:hypothetical protein|nr:hypothetical protein [Patescibacteria group bacterium]
MESSYDGSYNEDRYWLTGQTPGAAHDQLHGRGSSGPSAEDVRDDDELFVKIDKADFRLELAQAIAAGYVPEASELAQAMAVGYVPQASELEEARQAGYDLSNVIGHREQS